MKRSLDIGCGSKPKNPFSANELYGIDIRDSIHPAIKVADLNLENIPFEDDYFDAVTCYDFIEHVPRILYTPERRFPFICIMNEIFRVLKTGGLFLSFTPAFPKAPAWRDPTHVNIITDETFPLYFCEPEYSARMYGFNGNFSLLEQRWDPDNIHLISILKKI